MCFELPADGTLPEWVPLIPVGDVVGRDGRHWTNNNPDQVIAATLSTNRDQPLDYEHATELKAPNGDEAPAAGWFKDYRVRNGHIEGQLELNPRGAASVAGKEYRYLSPVFRHNTANEIYDIRSVALTNRGNLLLPALNRETQPEKATMELAEFLAALATALNIEGTTTPEQVLAAVNNQSKDLQTARNSEQQPDLTLYVPTATHEAALARAMNAEQQLATIATAEKTKKISSALDGAIAAGKIAPADREFYETSCNAEGGLDRFVAFIKSTPGVTTETGLDRQVLKDHETAMNAEEQQIAALFGNSPEDLKTYGA